MTPKPLPRFEIRQTRPKRGQPREYYFVLIAKNGRAVATGETYKTHAGAKKACHALVKLLENAVILDKADSP